MTSSPTVSVLDVGHGNSTVVVAEDWVAVVDAAPGETLIMSLKAMNIQRVDVLLLSHADEDHIGGVVALLSEPSLSVREIFLNPDAIRRTECWTDLRTAVADARRRGTVKVQPSLTTETSGRFSCGDLDLQILAPTPDLALVGVGGKTLSGKAVTANAMSVVVRIVFAARGEVLLAGDIDSVGLDELLKEPSARKSKVLVFPHHGGLPGRGVDPEAFAQRLCAAVEPEVVVFSIGRGIHGTPQPQILHGVFAWGMVKVVCTQLAEACASTLPASEASHLGPLPARGRTRGACCGGTLEFVLGTAASPHRPSIAAHQGFVGMNAPSALCRRTTAGGAGVS